MAESATQTQAVKETEAVPTILKSSSLYVGDLAPNVSESEIYNIFVKENITGILSIRVCRDINTRSSLGYAYINFEDEKKAEQALESLRAPVIAGKACRIMWSIRDPSIRKSGVGNIFIKNLEAQITNEDLYRLFLDFVKEQRKTELEQSGAPSDIIISDSDVKDEILSCKVACDRNNYSKGYGFVHFQRPELAEKAKKKFHGLAFNGKIVFVGDFIPRKDRQARSNQNTFTNVYIKDLDKETIKTTEDLENLFKEFGTITSAKLMTDKDNQSKGFGFVNFEDHESAVKAIEGRREYLVNGKQIYVNRALSKEEREREKEQLRGGDPTLFGGDGRKGKLATSNCNLYVKNLVDKIDDAKLRETFQPYGNITSAKVMMNENVSKGFGFVCFSTPEEASAAILGLDKKLLEGKPLYVAIAQQLQERRRQLDILHAQRGNPRTQQIMPAGAYPHPGYPPVFAYGRGMVPPGFPAGGPMFQMPVPMQQTYRGQNLNRRPHPVAPGGRGQIVAEGVRRDVENILKNKDPTQIVNQLQKIIHEKREQLESQQILATVERLMGDIEKEAGNPDSIQGLACKVFTLIGGVHAQ